MSVVHPYDLVINRVLAGRILDRTDRITPSAVYSNRLQEEPPAWTFRDYRAAWREMRERSVELVRSGYLMARLDVSSYYPTVNLDELESLLLLHRCEPAASQVLLSRYRNWQSEGLVGLPIGTEDASVLGNAYLLPLDWRLLALPLIQHTRWVDDVSIFARDMRGVQLALGASDGELQLLALARSEEKTILFDSAEQALAALEDNMLTSLFQRPPHKRLQGELLHRRFVEHVLDTEIVAPHRYRALVASLFYRRDPYATFHIADRPDLFDIDPALTGDYLRAFALSQRPATNNLLRLLDESSRNPQDLTDARDLHILRILEGRVWGREEGELFARIAYDETRRDPIRAWAIACLARTTAWDPGEIVERVLEESTIYLRRSMVLSLGRSMDEPRTRSLIRHLRRNPDELFSCAVWIDR